MSLRALLFLPMVLGGCARGDGPGSDGPSNQPWPVPPGSLAQPLACEDPTAWFPDRDGDGYGDGAESTRACVAPDGDYVSVGEDCDDTDATVHPGADEHCDGVDDDCDGQTDEADAVDAASWYRDEDGDGYGDPERSEQRCVPRDGWVEDGSDCDDEDAAVHPGGLELCNGVDGDCNGLVDDVSFWKDADGDFYGDPDDSWVGCPPPEAYVQASYGEDCDDADESVHPGATEELDGVDDDCDGTVDDVGLGDLGSRLDGASSGDGAGWAVASAGDVDGDGWTDLLVGAPLADGSGNNAGAAYLVAGPSSAGGLSAALAILEGVDDDDLAGGALAGAGDVDGDDHADLWIGARMADPKGVDAGAVYLVHGPIEGWVGLDDADATAAGLGSGDNLGQALCAGFDHDGDGTPDLLVGAYQADRMGAAAGEAYLFEGPVSGAWGADGADATLLAEGDHHEAGCAVASPGDVDGDGLDDLLVGASGFDGSSSRRGAAYLLSGPVRGVFHLVDGAARLVGESDGDRAGSAVAGAGDVDGDGLVDLLVGAYQAGYAHDAAGAAYLVLGPASGEVDLGEADARLDGVAEAEYAGYALAGPGDTDGDGYADLAIASHEVDSRAGATWLVRGPVTGVLSLTSADAVLLGEAHTDYAGYALSSAGDQDGDGLPDLLLGAINHDAGGSDAGAAYVVGLAY